ncbi:MAG: alpha-L-rhamnosidase N-terminal domain-containing protein [Leadbetterella sp.]
MPTTRREFLGQSLALGTIPSLQFKVQEDEPFVVPDRIYGQSYGKSLDLSPAQWIWFPGGRTLANTFMWFRKDISITKSVKSAKGWILGDSRYKLYLNGQRIQWGPAPSDPRWSEADPVDFTKSLKQGLNQIGAEVLFYGNGDGTWPIGKPGFIFYLDIQYQDGTSEILVSDPTWKVKIAQAWKPGQYKRWYLRSLQEIFDNREYDNQWHVSDTAAWLDAVRISGSEPTKPILASWGRDYLYDAGGGNLQNVELRQRSVPTLKEEIISAKQLSSVAILEWKVPVQDFFDFDMAEKLAFEGQKTIKNEVSSSYEFDLVANQGLALTFEFAYQSVGFPMFQVEAPEGTIIELLVHEGHDVNGKNFLINTHFNSWGRYTCKEGLNTFETFDYESFRWLQLHIHGSVGKIKVSLPQVRRRLYPFVNQPKFKSSDPKLNKLFDACVNTIYNNSHETIVDGNARERQQYSGDLGQMVHSISRGFGEQAMLARYLNTFSQGITKGGVFLDTWPAYDRLARLMEREIGITDWGPIVDHGVGFNLDCYHYYMYTADTIALKEVYPRLKLFFGFIKNLRLSDHTFPTENLGVPMVWIDHEAYKHQKHKACALSLLVAVMCKVGLRTVAKAMNDPVFAKEVQTFGEEVHRGVVKKYFKNNTFICNLPWSSQEGEERMCDYSLGVAIKYGLHPGSIQKSVDTLAQRPSNLGISYSANAHWRYWALGIGGRMDIVLKEYREQWFSSPSVQLNNTLAEFLDIKPDNTMQWSHASISPFYSIYMDMAGIKIVEPAYRKVEIRPQIGDLTEFYVQNHTPFDSLTIDIKNGTCEVYCPKEVSGTLIWNGKLVELISGGITNLQ